jgi:hypothetical protein
MIASKSRDCREPSGVPFLKAKERFCVGGLTWKAELEMTQNAIWDSEGHVLYYWHDHNKGIHFQIEYYADPDGIIQNDTEVQFIMPTSEFAKVYEFFEIDPELDIHQALNVISASGRGEDFCSELEKRIEIVDRFVWVS